MSLLIKGKQFFHTHKRSFLAFLSVGMLTGGVYFSLFHLLWSYLGLHYQIAISIAYVLAVTFYFFANRHFTFKSDQHNHIRHQLPKFLVLVVFNYLVTLFVVHCVVEVLNLPPYIGLFFAVGTTTVLNYLIAKFWVFQIRAQKEI